VTDSSRDLRADARTLIAAALRSVDPVRGVADALADLPEMTPWAGAIALDEAGPARSELDRVGGGRTLLVGVGKAAGGMVAGAVAVLGGVDAGVVVIPDGAPCPPLPDSVRVHRASHPLPDGRSVEAAAAVRALLEDAGSEDRLLVLLSGGGSSLVTDPVEGVRLEDVRAVHRMLLRSGWPIQRVNAVRRVLDRLKGGGMARLALPARPVALVLSDIPGGALEDVASGPLSPSPATPRDIEIGLRRDGWWDELPERVRASLVARRDEASSATPEVILHGVGSGIPLLDAVRGAASGLGYTVRSLGTSLEGEARRIGRGVARAAIAVQEGVVDVPRPACLVGVGEATVQVTGDGVGGPNQEVAVAAALELAGRAGVLVASVGTDGVDGVTEAAGGWADGHSAVRAEAAGIDLAAALDHNDSGRALAALGDRIVTGPTGTNVADLYLALVE
jgi:glycerate-2-kinase